MARWRLRMEDFGRRQERGRGNGIDCSGDTHFGRFAEALQEGGNRTSEAWHQPRWASKASSLSKGAPGTPAPSPSESIGPSLPLSGTEEERPPSSGGSTRCPSSARGRHSPAPSVGASALSASAASAASAWRCLRWRPGHPPRAAQEPVGPGARR